MEFQAVGSRYVREDQRGVSFCGEIRNRRRGPRFDLHCNHKTRGEYVVRLRQTLSLSIAYERIPWVKAKQIGNSGCWEPSWYITWERVNSFPPTCGSSLPFSSGAVVVVVRCVWCWIKPGKLRDAPCSTKRWLLSWDVEWCCFLHGWLFHDAGVKDSLLSFRQHSEYFPRWEHYCLNHFSYSYFNSQNKSSSGKPILLISTGGLHIPQAPILIKLRQCWAQYQLLFGYTSINKYYCFLGGG